MSNFNITTTAVILATVHQCVNTNPTRTRIVLKAHVVDDVCRLACRKAVNSSNLTEYNEIEEYYLFFFFTARFTIYRYTTLLLVFHLS